MLHQTPRDCVLRKSTKGSSSRARRDEMFASAPDRVVAAYAINNAGQITGVASIGGHRHAFLLTPAARGYAETNRDNRPGHGSGLQHAAAPLPLGDVLSALFVLRPRRVEAVYRPAEEGRKRRPEEVRHE